MRELNWQTSGKKTHSFERKVLFPFFKMAQKKKAQLKKRQCKTRKTERKTSKKLKSKRPPRTIIAANFIGY